MKHISIIHGPNLNMLGTRETSVYGDSTLSDINDSMINLCKQHNAYTVDPFQSNSESKIIDYIHANHSKSDFLIINPAALGHTSVILRDALMCLTHPFIEVHLSNPFSREEFRHISYTNDIALGNICGFGAHGYILALQAAFNYLENNSNGH